MMDTSEYMPMFLAESQEHLQDLNLAVVALEEHPEDREKVDAIFRIAHSLKGMSATMGFAAVAALTHEMEDVFELLRQRTTALSREAVDTLLLCLDALSAAFDSIESSGEEQFDPEPLVARLRDLVRARNAEQLAARAGGRIVPDLGDPMLEGMRIVHVAVTLEDEVLMPAVRAHMVLVALADHGELIGSAPTPDGVEQFDGRVVEGWLVGEDDAAVIAASVSAITDVVGVELAELEAGGAPVAPAVAMDVPPAAQADPAPADVPGAAAPADPAPADVPAPAGSADPAPADVPGPAASGEVEDLNPHRVHIRQAEEQPVPPKPSTAARTVRVDAERLDSLMHAMGELVIQRTAVEVIAAELDAPELHHAMQELTRTSQALQSMVMQVRMIPVEAVFLRFPRLVRDLSAKLGKQVELELIGSDTELDRTVVDALGDPLVHLVRNALDHGLERADERADVGKEPAGHLQISARQAGSSVVIEVRDDGRGVDATAVGRRAAAIGLIDPAIAESIDSRTAVELLFTPGFSTATSTSDISGRGVGMDAVRTRIRELGGEVLVDSVPGEGTIAQIRLPLTLAIVSGLLVAVGDGPYAIPLDRIERTLLLAAQNVQSVTGEQLLVLDDGVVPLLDGSRVFGRPPAPHAFAVILRAHDQRIALAVDELIGQRELVTRPLPAVVSSGEPVSGGTALPDGRIALIVDCDALHTRTLPRPDVPAHPDQRATAAIAA